MKNDLQKRISLASIAALVAGILVMVPVAPANAATTVALDGTNAAASAGAVNASLLMATQRATTAVIHPTTAVATTGHAARSSGLTAKSVASDGTGQTATVRAGGVLSLYAQVSTSVAITADGGSFSSAGISVPSLVSNTTAPTTNGKFFANTTGTATPIAVLWQSPTTAGSYTIKLHVSNATSNTITAATALGGTLAADIVVTVTAAAHDVVGGTNYPLFPAKADDALFVAVENSTTGASIVSSASTTNDGSLTPRSIGLLSKDSTVSTAQTATVLAGGALSFYANVSTNVAFIASGGSFSGAVIANSATNVTYSNDIKTVFLPGTSSQLVAVRWNAPTTPGTYTVSMNRASETAQVTPTAGSGGTLTGAITVTVVAASAGGSYSATYSLCNTRSAAQGHGVATGVDTTSAITNGQTAYIAFDLDDAYDQPLDSGAVIVTATGGALVSLASNGSTAAAGTTTTVVSSRVPSDQVVQVTQGTANAPQTATITISFNGTTVCTKTITHRGEIAKLVVSNIGTGDINSANSITPGLTTWMAATIGVTDRAGLFTVSGVDSAGNTVVTNAGGTFAADSASLTTTVQALSVTNTATTISTTADTYAGLAFGTWTCGASAGSSPVKLTWTNSGSGKVVTSDAFTARCADDPYTYTASFDKASYVQGEIATLTVQFLDSKGNKANTVGLHNALATGSFPMMTAITAFSGVVANKNDGTRTYTFTVGGTTAVTAGSYVAIVEYASLLAGTKQTPAYKVSTGSTDVSNAEVLKSIVALIASINKQIQALQKLILRR